MLVEAKVRGWPAALTRENLVAAIQNVIWTSSGYHAAVNFPQWEYMAYCPNMPLALYGDGDDRDLLGSLPPFAQVVQQVRVMDLLTSYRHDRLGCYSEADTAALSKYERSRLEVFASDLDLAEKKIDARNRLRRTPYPYLKPSLVPNSTSV